MNVELIFDIIQSVSIIIASIVAIRGINSWRNEAKWKRRYELTSNVLKSFYEAKEAIDYVRFPGSYKSEGSTRKRNKDETAKETESLDLAYVTIERLEKSIDVFIKLKSLKFDFMAEIGLTESKPFIELERIKNDLVFASNMLGSRYWNPNQLKRIERVPDKNQDFEVEQTDKFEKVIWSNAAKDDETSLKLNGIITDIETECRKIIGK